ncbi:MAG: helix-turn-helix transcriptional regulator [Alphaproteobacteria bacterium]|nr:helix-turn-helix transcriptional regulator [Alphaproteobacteria bacterium]
METRLKELLQEKGMMSKTLAEKMKISEVSVSSLINGKTNNLETLAKAAECLGVEMWELFKKPNEENQVQKGRMSLVCPHCGKSITLKVE